MMQLRKWKLPIVILALVYISPINNGGASIATTWGLPIRPEINISNESGSFQIAEYKILKKTCSEENSCYLIVYTNSKFFNKEDLLKMVITISKKCNEARSVTLNLFDDLELAKSFASGERELVNLFADVRGRYIRGGGKEFLMFSPDKSRINDTEKLITLDLTKPNM